MIPVLNGARAGVWNVKIPYRRFLFPCGRRDAASSAQTQSAFRAYGGHDSERIKSSECYSHRVRSHDGLPKRPAGRK